MLPVAVLTRRAAMRILPGVLLAVGMVGCGGKLALKPLRAPCPGFWIPEMVWSPDSTHIAYQAADPYESYSDLYLFELNSGKTTRVTRTGDFAISPEWLPDSTQIAYIEADIETHTGDLYMYDLITGRRNRIAELGQHDLRPVWSPDGAYLLTGVEVDEAEYEIFTVDLNGMKHSFAEHIFGELSYQWSPDAQHIAVTYQGLTEPQSDLIVLRRDQEIVWRLSELYPDLDIYLVSGGNWSPDGTRLVFNLILTPHDMALAIISASGTDLHLYPLPNGFPNPIEWSPDGDWIAASFRDATDHSETISIFEPDDFELEVLVKGDELRFQWLQDSSGIIYTKRDKEIATAQIDGTSHSILSSGPEGNFANRYFVTGDFSPDNTMTAYIISGQFHADEIHVMPVDETELQQITDNPGNHKCFQWPF
jgi:Tol biopolymer transport system component